MSLVAALLAVGCVDGPPRGALPTFAPTAAHAPAVAATASASPDCAAPCRNAPVRVGSFPVAQAREASGLAASRRHAGVLYVLDDGPGSTGVLVISARDASLLGRVTVAGLEGVDTEALAVGPCAPLPGTCVYVGDIGDNLRGRDSIAVLRFREPRRPVGEQTVEAERINLRYPDGPHDAEALLVDGQGRLAIITKQAREGGKGAARLYVSTDFRDATLTDRGRLPVPLPSLPFAAAAVGNVVTGADWAPGRVAVRTYDAIFEFRSPTGREGLIGFADWPVTEVPVASEPQGEAVAYGRDGCAIFTVSEASGALSAALCR